MRPFVEQIVGALHDYLEPYLDLELYVDFERLHTGYVLNEALARAICESLCMVVIYVPKYERHFHCLREFAAMEALETRRFQMMGSQADRDLSMIIPIILRGEHSFLPEKIRQIRHYADFSRFTTASTNILRNREYVAKVEEIVDTIVRIYRSVQTAGVDITAECDGFRLPDNPPGLRPEGTIPLPPFPGRASGI